MVKVALVNAGLGLENAVHEPLNLGFIASYLLQNGIEVKLIDQLACQNVEKELKGFNPDIVGITGTSSVIYEAYKIADMCRSLGILTVIGGVHASVLPQEAMQHSDVVVKGEGERAMLKVIRKKIAKGIVQCNYIQNLDELPHPARYLMDMEFYSKTRDRTIGTHLHFVEPKTRVGAIMAQRGCPFSCIFCHNSWRGMPVRFHSAKFIVEEMEELIEKYKIQSIFFMDDDFLASKKRIEKLCSFIKEENLDIPWGCQTRVVGLNFDLLSQIKKAGCKQLTFGMESGSQRILSLLKNNTATIEQNKKAISMCKAADIMAVGSFMIGSPTETVEDIKLTQKFIRDNSLDGIGVHMTTAFPGTKLWQIAVSKNQIPTNLNWKDFTTGKFSLNLTDSIPTEQLNKLYQETIDIAFKINNFGSKKALLKLALKHPYKSIKKAIRSPFDVIQILSR